MSRDDPFGEIERVFDQLTDVGLTGSSVPVDVVERTGDIEVTADLPGYDAADIDVQLREGHLLEISAERSAASSTTDGTVHRSERHRESVSRSLSLPAPVEESGTDASFSNGVLTVALPKRTPDDEGTDIPVS